MDHITFFSLSHEEQEHVRTYQRAENDYDDAYIEKARAENEMASVINRKRAVINKLNSLNSEYKCKKRSYDKLVKAASKNDDIEVSRKDTRSKLDTASAGYAAIGTCSANMPKKLNDVFEASNNRTDRLLSQSFAGIKKAQASVKAKLEELESKINSLKGEKEECEHRERQLREVISEQDRIMRRASFEMSVNRRYMY